MPELIVTPTSFIRHLIAWSGVLLLLYAMPAPIDSKLTAAHTANVSCGYDATTPIDAKTAGEFVIFWATRAFDYSPETMQANHFAASKWNNSDALTTQLKKTFWSADAATRPTKFEKYRLRRVDVLGKDTAAISIDMLFSWDGAGLKKMPVNFHMVVKKCQAGYRMDSVQVQ